MVTPNEVEDMHTKTTWSKSEGVKHEESNQKDNSSHSLSNFSCTKPLNIVTTNIVPAVTPAHHIMDSNKSNE
jgi:hypothetical protein